MPHTMYKSNNKMLCLSSPPIEIKVDMEWCLVIIGEDGNIGAELLIFI